MNTQELVDQNLKILLGDLQVQLIFARTRISELEAQLAAAAVTGEMQAVEIPDVARPNGVDLEETKKPPRRPQ
jgi:hypothetical protein